MEPISAKAEKTGGLNAVKVDKNASASSAGIEVDTAEKTVTIPVVAENSTNGLFTLSYDASLLTLKKVSYGGVTLHSMSSSLGEIRIGYASADAYTGKVARLVFSYDKVDEMKDADFTFVQKEDGTNFRGEKTDFSVRLQVFETGSGSTPSKNDDRDFGFEDVSRGDWFYDSVNEMVGLGYMTGISSTKFAPNNGLTRAMLVTILYRIDGKEAVSAKSAFTDVVKGSYYEDAVNWASAKGIVNGYSATRFAPNDPITRQQLAAILWRYAQYKGVDVSANGMTMPDFSDRSEIASWAGEAVSWAYSRGIMAGMSATKLDPNGGATRAQAATMILRYLNLKNTGDQVKA